MSTHIYARLDPNQGCTKATCDPIYSIYGYRPSLPFTLLFLTIFALSACVPSVLAQTRFSPTFVVCGRLVSKRPFNVTVISRRSSCVPCLGDGHPYSSTRPGIWLDAIIHAPEIPSSSSRASRVTTHGSNRSYSYPVSRFLAADTDRISPNGAVSTPTSPLTQSH